jgi:hypothetical protein
MRRTKYAFGWKRDHKLSTLDNLWFTMRDNLIGRFIEFLANDGTLKRFEILEIEMRLPLHNSIVILGSPQLRDPIGLSYMDIRELLFEGEARFVDLP